MTSRTHYQVLGIAPEASAAVVRDAYRQRAREHHPDRARSSAAGYSAAMPEVNEAYRVLSDPGRRAMYDAGLRDDRAATSSSGSASSAGPVDAPPDADDAPWRYPAHPGSDGPARVPWRGLLVAGTVACIGIIALAQFTEPGEDPGPDGVLRGGDCVQIEANNDASEISCSGEGDLVVRDLVPFDRPCPGGTQAYRDRQGMGIACIDRPISG